MAEEGVESLEKALWTDADFALMGWHDATVHALAIAEDDDQEHELGSLDLMLDLDYIVRWTHPQPPDPCFSFLVAPATLVFENVSNLAGELEPYGSQLEIAEVHRLEAQDDSQRIADVCPWRIEGHNFELTFLAGGFRQHFRARPRHTSSQALSIDERGGISFAQPRAFPNE